MTKPRTPVCRRCGTVFEPHGKFEKHCSLECAVYSRLRQAQSGCLEWFGATHKFGYGEFRFRGQFHRAHTAVWIVHNGPVPQGKTVNHHCDNPRCAEISHLYLGTHRENMRDVAVRNRVGTRKLKPSDACSIKWALSTSNRSFSELGREYGVTYQTIMDINNEKTWTHIPWPS